MRYLFFFLGLLLFSCNADKGKQNPMDADESVEEEVPVIPERYSEVVIKTPEGKDEATFYISEREILIWHNDNRSRLTALIQKNKTIYVNLLGDKIAEVISEKGGFKVLSVEGREMWKVTREAGKYFFTERKEAKYSREIQPEGKTLLKALKNGKLAGYVTATNRDIKIEGSGLKLTLAEKQVHPAMAVFLFRDVIATERMILTAELFYRK